MNIWRNYKHQILTLIAHVNLFWLFPNEVIVWGLVASFFVSLFAHNLYMHRVYTHQQFKWTKGKHTIGQFLFCTLNLGAPSVYSAVHINHHKYSDTDKDPHPPSWKALFSLWDSTFRPDIRTLKRNKPTDKFYGTYFYIAIASMLLTPFLIVGAHWHSKLVTTVVHLGGKPTNVKWLYPLLLGEEMHERHHNNWKENRHHRYDILYQVGKLLSTR